MSLLYREAAHVVHRDNGTFATYNFFRWKDAYDMSDETVDCMRTVSYAIRVPEIILLMHYDRIPKQEVKLTRKNVYLRDKNTCQYCGRVFKDSELNLDHVVPRRLGGATTWTNIVCSCIGCNLKKGEKTLREAGLMLIRTPKKPRWSPFNSIAFRRGVYSSWEHFLDPSGWKIQISDVETCPSDRLCRVARRR
jgi:5-methylcytosine-specific restriction endonuclease McrA